MSNSICIKVFHTFFSQTLLHTLMGYGKQSESFPESSPARQAPWLRWQVETSSVVTWTSALLDCCMFLSASSPGKLFCYPDSLPN